MTGQAVVRILPVITLIVTAHAIKPFSLKNITTHFLYSTRSFTFALPDSARPSFDQFSQLAVNFSNSLFENGQVDRSPATNMQAYSGVVALNTRSTAADTKPVLKHARLVIKRQTRVEPAVRLEEDGLTELELVSSAEEAEETEAASSADDVAAIPAGETGVTGAADSSPVALPAAQIISAAIPVALPHINVVCALSKVRPLNIDRFQNLPQRIEFLFYLDLPKKPDCDNRDRKQSRLMALAEEVKKFRIDLSRRERSLIPILECEDEGTEVVTGDEEAAGPQADYSQTWASEEIVFPTNPQRATDSCSIQPEQ
jgi:hypothetical protein